MDLLARLCSGANEITTLGLRGGRDVLSWSQAEDPQFKLMEGS